MTDELRAVIEAARRWFSEDRFTNDPDEAALAVAVRVFEEALRDHFAEPNKPGGFVMTRPWELIPAGWFVKTPNGEWYEVIGNVYRNGKQNVTLKAPDGKTGTFPRDPKAEVKVRRGTQTTRLSDAIEALSDTFEGTSIVEDEPPWDK